VAFFIGTCPKKAFVIVKEIETIIYWISVFRGIIK